MVSVECVRSIVESEGVCVGRVVYRNEHGASVLYTESDEKLVGYETIVFVLREEEKKGEDGSQMSIQEVSSPTLHIHTHTFPLPLHTAPPSPLQCHRTDSQDGSLHRRTGLASGPNRRGQSDPKDKRCYLLPQEH